MKKISKISKLVFWLCFGIVLGWFFAELVTHIPPVRSPELIFYLAVALGLLIIESKGLMR